MINIVLYEPEIPQNTGNIMRTCSVFEMKLHLIEPFGFILDDKHLRRSNRMAVAPRTAVTTSSPRKVRLPRIANPLRHPPTISRRKASRQPRSNRPNRAPLRRCRPSSLLPKMMPTLRFSSLV